MTSPGTLGMEVHEEAERLEHFISERFEDRVAAILGDPEIDQHGHVIPHRNGTIPVREESPLLQLSVGAPATVSSVSDHQQPFCASFVVRDLCLVQGWSSKRGIRTHHWSCGSRDRNKLSGSAMS